MKRGDKIIANDGENDFLGEVTYEEDGIVYFDVENDCYNCLTSELSLMGHMDNRDWWRAEAYDG